MTAKSFIVWAGGKSKLYERIANYFPQDITTYIEPFVGGGSIGLRVLENNVARNVVFSDTNTQLINTFIAVRDHPDELIKRLHAIQVTYDFFETMEEKKLYYLEMRKFYNTSQLGRVGVAAFLIFLNKTGFNGLYRINSSGVYNVPFGQQATPNICDVDTIVTCSQLLQRVDLYNVDYKESYRHASGKTLFYFDPPYLPLSATSSFTTYAGEFGVKEHKELALFCQELHSDGHNFIVSSSDVELARELYKDFHIESIQVRRNISATGKSRIKVAELLITNTRKIGV